MMNYNGFGMALGNLSLLSNAKTRSISAENPTGEKGKGAMSATGTGEHCARDLGIGWKVSPSIRLEPKKVTTLAEITGPGVIQHIWMTCNVAAWRSLVLRFYWDDETNPSIEVPYGDFFCNGWCSLALINSLPVAVNPNGGMNSYWEMPFREAARITIENLGDEPVTINQQESSRL
jgi:hypothetical protein